MHKCRWDVAVHSWMLLSYADVYESHPAENQEMRGRFLSCMSGIGQSWVSVQIWRLCQSSSRLGYVSLKSLF